MIVSGLIITSAAVVYVIRQRRKNSRKKLTGTKYLKQPEIAVDKRNASIQSPFGNREIAGAGDDVALANYEKTLDRYLKLSVGALGLTTLDFLFKLPFLTLASIPILAYIFWGFVPIVYQQITKERRIGIDFINLLFGVLMLASGLVGLLAFVSTIYFGAEKVSLKTRDRSKKQLVDIFGGLPKMVWVLHDGVEIQRALDTLQAGDIVVVNAGEMIPADGVLLEGVSSIDQHALTGEAQPVEKEVGDPVFATTVVLSGRILVKIEQAGKTTVAAQIGEVMNNTAGYQSSVELRGEVIANKAIIPTLITGGLTTVLLGVHSGMAALTTYCGYNVRLTAPISLLNFLSLASKQGTLVKDGLALETIEKVDTVIFDKTGTLTQTQPHVGAIHPLDGYTEDDILSFAAGAEHRQSHPIAKAILQAAAAADLSVPDLAEAAYEVGYGLTVKLTNGHQIRVGSVKFMRMEAVDITPAVKKIQADCDTNGYTLIYVAVDDHLAGVIELHATLRPETSSIVQKLQQRGLRLYIISGDQEQPTRRLANQLGIDDYFAEVLPQDKARLVEQLQNEGRTVCFVGDGINDSIALKQADVSISLRGATTIATDAAQVILLDGTLQNLPTLFELVDSLNKNMKFNFASSVLPAAISLVGIYTLHFGIIKVVLIDSAGLFIGLANASLPALKQKLLNAQTKT